MEEAIREVPRRVGLDVKAVHGVVQALLALAPSIAPNAASLFPVTLIHVDFTLTKAA
ncbi:MAG: hypothetical protein ACK4K8_16780 [Pannonibacter sp.]